MHENQALRAVTQLSLIFWPLLLASHLFLVLNDTAGYTQGLRIDYLFPKLWAVTLINCMIILSSFLHGVKFKLNTYTGVGLALLGLSQSFALLPVTAISHLGQLLIGALAAWCVVQLIKGNRQYHYWLGAGIALSVCFQAAVGGYQWWTQRSVAGYWLLGEPNISQHLGLARTADEQVLAYGTTAHPNVFAGSLVLLSSIGLLTFLKQHHTKKREGSVVVSLIGCVVSLQSFAVFITESWSAAAAAVLFWSLLCLQCIKQHQLRYLIIGMSYFLILCAVVYLHTIESKSLSIIRRQDLLNSSLQILGQNWLIGTGLSSFTQSLSMLTTHSSEVTRFVQPVHTALILWVVETGLVGTFFLTGFCLQLISYAQKKSAIEPLAQASLVLLPLLVWDHYLLSFIPAWTLGWFFILFRTKT